MLTYIHFLFSQLILCRRRHGGLSRLIRSKSEYSPIAESEAVAIAKKHDTSFAHYDPFPLSFTLVEPCITTLA